MATFSYLRLAAFVFALSAASAPAADVTKGSSADRDKDKKGVDTHASVEQRTVTRESSSSPSPPNDPRNGTAPVPAGARPTARAPTFSAPAMQPRFSGSSPVARDNWRDRDDRD